MGEFGRGETLRFPVFRLGSTQSGHDQISVILALRRIPRNLPFVQFLFWPEDKR
jgi:hypothetical protein